LDVLVCLYFLRKWKRVFMFSALCLWSLEKTKIYDFWTESIWNLEWRYTRKKRTVIRKGWELNNLRKEERLLVIKLRKFNQIKRKLRLNKKGEWSFKCEWEQYQQHISHAVSLIIWFYLLTFIISERGQKEFFFENIKCHDGII